MKNAAISGSAVEEIRRQLAFIENPTERLKLLFTNNLKDDAQTELNALVEKGFFFQDPSRIHGVQLDTVKFSRQVGAEPIVCSRDSEIYFTLPGIAKFFGWTKKQLTDFINLLFKTMMEKIDPASGWKEIATWAGSWEINATERIFEMYRPKDKKFCAQIERWLLLCHFYDGDHFFHYLGDKWYEKWIGWTKPQKRYTYHDDNGAVEEQTDIQTSKVNALTKRLEAMGMSRDEIGSILIRWLEKYSERGLDFYFHAMVVNALAMPYESKRKNAALAKLTDRAIEQFFKGTLHHYTFASLAREGMKSDPTFREKYTDQLAYTLGKGKIAWANALNNLVGKMLFDDEKLDLKSVAPLAFDKAVQAGKFGIAAALVLQFGEEECFNEKILSARVQGKNQRERKQMLAQLVEERKTQIRESFGIAKTASQPVRLDFHCSLLKQY